MMRRAPATERLTVGQALVRYLAAQRVERDGVERPFFAGMFGIFGLGNKESLKFTPREGFYERLDGRDKLYRKVK